MSGTARLSPFRVHVADQILAALTEAAPLPLSTMAIEDRTGYGRAWSIRCSPGSRRLAMWTGSPLGASSLVSGGHARLTASTVRRWRDDGPDQGRHEHR